MSSDLEDELHALLGPESDTALAEMVTELVEVSATASKAEGRKKELKKMILAKLDESGMTAATVAGRKIYTSERSYYGIDPNQLPAAKAWIERVAPEVNIPAAANVGKAVSAFLDENPSADIPSFITTSKTVTLNNRKA